MLNYMKNYNDGSDYSEEIILHWTELNSYNSMFCCRRFVFSSNKKSSSLNTIPIGRHHGNVCKEDEFIG